MSVGHCQLFFYTMMGCWLANQQPVRGENPGSTLRAGVARIDITNPRTLPVRDRLFVRALVLRSGETTAVLITVDAVAIGGIGPIGNEYLDRVRGRLGKELGVPSTAVVVNASHCHGIVCDDMEEKTVAAVRLAMGSLVAVKVGAGSGHEDRIMENRRLRLKSGREVDVRHAYSLPPEEEVVGAGPVDPQIGLLRLDQLDGTPLAVVFNFACHPIMGLPGGENTADISGFACKTIEETLGGVALFVQGCGGDINPIRYKDASQPRDAEPLGTRLGVSAMRTLRQIGCASDAPLRIVAEKIGLPRADLTRDIARLEAELIRLTGSLQGTTLDLKSFLAVLVRHDLSPDFPAGPSHRYLHEKKMGRDDLEQLDTTNRRDIQAYRNNIHTMEALTRNQTNLALLRRHQKDSQAAGFRPMEVEVMGLRVGDFSLVTFPGELTAQIGLNIKAAAKRPNNFVAGYTNGYIFYTPTAEQLKNRGGAQEDSDCLVAPEWQALFEKTAQGVLEKLRK